MPEQIAARQALKRAELFKQLRLLRSSPAFGRSIARGLLGGNAQPRHLDGLVLYLCAALVIDPQPRREHGLYRVIDRAEKAFSHEHGKLYLLPAKQRLIIEHCRDRLELFILASIRDSEDYPLAPPVAM